MTYLICKVDQWPIIPLGIFIPICTGDKTNIQNYQGTYQVEDLKLQSMSFDQVHF